jgi:hypothetical protein
MLRAVLAVSLVLLAGCGGDETPAPASWDGPPRPTEDGDVAVDGFNAYAETIEAAWRRSPLLTVVEFLALEEPEASTTSLVLRQTPERFDDAVVTATTDGLLDDSVRGQRYVLELERQDGVWRLLSARVAWRCQAGRGQQDFAPELCS